METWVRYLSRASLTDKSFMVLCHDCFNARSKLGEADIEGAAERHDGVERRRFVAELKERYVGAIKPCVKPEGFLRLFFPSP